MKLTLRKTGKQVAGKHGSFTFLLANFEIQLHFNFQQKFYFNGTCDFLAFHCNS